MNCYLHVDRQAELHCAACGNLICEQCDVLLADHHVCKQCLANAESVPPQLSGPEGGSMLSRVNFGAAAVTLAIGGIMGITGAGILHDYSQRNYSAFLSAITAAVFAGFVTYAIGALIVRLIVPGHTIKQKGGVLGLFGISDIGAFAFFTLITMVIAWVSMG